MSYVYFMKPIGKYGPIKIGFSINPEGRLAGLSAACPFPIHLVTKFKATQATEFTLHKKFSHAKIYGEWFDPVPELLDFVEHVRCAVNGHEDDDYCGPTPCYSNNFLTPEFDEFLASEKDRRQREQRQKDQTP